MDFSLLRGVLCKKEEKDTACWGVHKVNGPLERMYFKLPKMDPDDIRLKVTNAGICHTDSSMIDNIWGIPVVYPLVPGHEIAGIVEKVGENVKKYKPGDRVLFGTMRDCCKNCSYCLTGNDQFCSEILFKQTYCPFLGGFSTLMQVKQSHVFPMNPVFDPKKIAPIMCAGVTTFAPLKKHGFSGCKCAILGIGGLGHLALMFASKMGMKTYAVSTTKDKEIMAKKLGASEYVCSSDPEQMKRFQKEKIDLIICCALLTDLSDYMRALKMGSGVCVEVALPDLHSPVKYNHLELVAHQLTLTGSAVGSIEAINETLDFAAFHNIQPVTENYKWSEFPKAVDKVAKGKPIFRCVVDTADTFDNL